jgi:hypothetical protein
MTFKSQNPSDNEGITAHCAELLADYVPIGDGAQLKDVAKIYRDVVAVSALRSR